VKRRYEKGDKTVVRVRANRKEAFLIRIRKGKNNSEQKPGKT
jgi:hypothetical protein